jgi:hypothetical protein
LDRVSCFFVAGLASDHNPPTYASCAAGITGMYHHTQPWLTDFADEVSDDTHKWHLNVKRMKCVTIWKICLTQRTKTFQQTNAWHHEISKRDKKKSKGPVDQWV